GESAYYCDECGDEIPEARRVAMKGVRLCIECQSTIELGSQRQGLFNRRASKDSQLR
ncbi:TPA: TraR/DksA C4-type zinc finger protein, partial [Vibrio parahaemolyticus]|nr:TraR/DksA C4-type zinc finger protein [Vibrio parahaemolyticus]HCG5315804.1 TraR/DksA C4-type zinc finger protein [Vibrio parahaemolyticus]HCG5322315.1 TraR/DksA C4-type zinc finger protein [Vibrio parahaemolyticus]